METEKSSKWHVIEPGYGHLVVRGNMTPAAQVTRWVPSTCPDPDFLWAGFFGWLDFRVFYNKTFSAEETQKPL